MLKILVALMAVVFLDACGGGDRVRAKARGGVTLGAVDYERLGKINQMQQDLIDARAAVHHAIAPSLSKKAEAIAAKITTSHCKKKEDIPDDDFTDGVKREWIVDVTEGSCPIYWYREREWNKDTKVMRMNDKIEIPDAGFRRDYAGFGVRYMAGSYKVASDNEGQRVAGTITISNFQTQEFGAVGGSVTIESRTKGDEGRGSVAIAIRGSGFQGTGAVSWRVARGQVVDVKFRIGNAAADQAQFNSLFSSYEWDKFMDNAINMK